MDITIHPRKLNGQLTPIPSKSQAHRILICAALADSPLKLICPETNRDIRATVDCLNALGAQIKSTDQGYYITPISTPPDSAVLNCCESGSTLRFLLPVAAALGIDTIFQMEGRLAQRPLSPLWEEMERMGCRLSRPDENTLHCSGILQAGTYTIPGNISSQYITGLMFALPLLQGNSRINITGKLESRPYVEMTQQALSLFGISALPEFISGCQHYHSPGSFQVEADWSNAAFFLAAGAMGNSLVIHNLNPNSLQGDRAIHSLLPRLRKYISISAADIPDLIPILSIFAACNQGAVFTDIQRLRLKESDRVASTIHMIRSLGGEARCTDDTLSIFPSRLTGGVVDAVNDHRIAMSTAIASTVCREDVVVLGAECVSKSYPKFWEEFSRLGGCYEQYLR